MKATGIIRRMDDLGRIVVPKSIRNLFGINPNEELEFFTDENGFYIRKYAPIGDINWDKLKNIADIMLFADNALLDKDGTFLIGGIEFDKPFAELERKHQLSPIIIGSEVVGYVATINGVNTRPLIRVLTEVLKEG